MSLTQDIDRGQKAARLLADAVFIEAFDAVKAAIHQKWEESPIRDTEGQHELRLMLKLLGDVRAYLETAVTDGKIAVDEVNRQNMLQTAARKLRGM